MPTRFSKRSKDHRLLEVAVGEPLCKERGDLRRNPHARKPGRGLDHIDSRDGSQLIHPVVGGLIPPVAAQGHNECFHYDGDSSAGRSSGRERESMHRMLFGSELINLD